MAAVLIADRMTGSWRAMTAGGTISEGGKGERDMLRVIRNEMESEEVFPYFFLWSRMITFIINIGFALNCYSLQKIISGGAVRVAQHNDLELKHVIALTNPL